ncbi:ribosome maturation factor RimP [Gordonia sp. ABSL1-1]|uniref:ribosome maturation factor RimP n=1 Tax=Gordonia sp. ABSL1-1 TaxID=3053923 RepID=UPI00257239CD|nr:ribosome maturation factor RimP [Gordonia sp. ABSL1-1]MDL9936299.1 ribosome maturation factor RimP [Gordonia sp. ABSL1-1]
MPSVSRKLSELVGQLVSDRGFDLEDVVVRPREGADELSIVVDRDGGSDLDVLAQLSNEISEALDAAGILGDEAYTLEVTSPGIDRPLSLPRHWIRARGRKVAITRQGADGERAELIGRVGPLDEQSVTIVSNLKGRIAVERVDFEEIVKAVVQVDFGKPSVAELTRCGLDDAEIAARRGDPTPIDGG